MNVEPAKLGFVQTPPLDGQAVTLLAISPDKVDRYGLRQIFRLSEWSLFEASARREARQLLENGDPRIRVVLCDRELAGFDWKNVLEDISALTIPLPLIVFSRFADNALWADVLNSGGFDVVAAPFEIPEILRVTTAASRWSAPAMGNQRQEGLARWVGSGD